VNDLDKQRAKRRAKAWLGLMTEKLGYDPSDEDEVCEVELPQWWEYRKPDRYRLLTDVARRIEAEQRTIAADFAIEHLITWERHEQIIREGAPSRWPTVVYFVPVETATGRQLSTDDLLALAHEQMPRGV